MGEESGILTPGHQRNFRVEVGRVMMVLWDDMIRCDEVRHTSEVRRT